MRVVIIGLGSIGNRHASVLQRLVPGVELYALRSNVEATNQPGITNIHSYGEIETLKPHFVLLSNPTSLHAAALLELIPLGYPLFIEKPVTDRIEDALAISSLIDENEIFTYVGCNLRYLGCLIFMMDFLKKHKEQIQEVNAYAGSYLPAWRPNNDFRKSYSADATKGGGVHLDLIHELDYIYWFFGEPKAIHSLTRSVSSLSINSADYANYQLLFPKFTVQLTLNYYRVPAKRKLEIVLLDRVVEVDILNNSVFDSTGKCLFESSQTIADTYYDQMQQFLHNLSLPAHERVLENSFITGSKILNMAIGR